MIVDPSVEAYLAGLEPEADAVRAEMEKRAADSDFPIVGPQVGRLLFLLTRLSGARRVLELGSGFGYSALWFARALPADGEVHLTEFSSERIEQARDYLGRAGLQERVRFHPGDALDWLERLSGPFDIVFNDVDKRYYPRVIDRAVALLRPGGLLITDNSLWYGKPADAAIADPDTEGVRAYNRRVSNHPDLQTVILPLRDGVAVSLRG